MNGTSWSPIARFWLRLTSSVQLAMPFYAVRRGKVPGIYSTWGECQEQILKFPGARYKKFATQQLAESFVSGVDHPEEASLQSGDWTGACKQKLTELVSTFSAALPVLNKYMTTLPDGLENKDLILAGFNETKADVTVCKESLTQLLSKIDGTIIDDKTNAKAAAKRKAKQEPEPSSSNKKPRNKVDSDDIEDWPVVYTDGACANNGSASPQAGIGVWWGPNDDKNISRRLEGRQTNNRAEIHAACAAVKQAADLGYSRLEIRTDSQFMINSMTQWIQGWKKKDWKLATGGPVKNAEDFQLLEKLIGGIEIKWTHVPAHSGIPGNEFADNLAVAGARKPYNSS